MQQFAVKRSPGVSLQPHLPSHGFEPGMWLIFHPCKQHGVRSEKQTVRALTKARGVSGESTTVRAVLCAAKAQRSAGEVSMARAAAERAIAGGDGSGTNIPLRTRRHIVRAAEEAELKRLFRTRHVLSCVNAFWLERNANVDTHN